jgi:hypothetical protein
VSEKVDFNEYTLFRMELGACDSGVYECNTCDTQILHLPSCVDPLPEVMSCPKCEWKIRQIEPDVWVWVTKGRRLSLTEAKDKIHWTTKYGWTYEDGTPADHQSIFLRGDKENE